MLAAQMTGVRSIRLRDIPVPEIQEDEILVKVKSVGICGTDMRIIGNGFPGIDEARPRVLGHEISGVVAAVGRNVASYKEGMRVAIAPNIGCGLCRECMRGDQHLCAKYYALGVQIDGGFAEYVKIPAAAVRSGNVFALPDHVGFDAAAVNEPLSCVYNGIRLCPIALGDDVLIIGAGPIGIMYAMMAKLAGAARVIVANRGAARLELARSVDPSFVTVQADKLKETIHELTEGRGVDVAVTANPSPEAQQVAVELTAMNGKINFFGGLPKDKQMVSINTNTVHYKQILLTGSTKANNEHFGSTLKFISSGILDVGKLVTARYPLDRFEEALEHASNGSGMKTVIAFDD
ncbi:alcohol dehydrogenase catalytic domain-containing protein [Paenibacillus sp.]|uniref:alcohol dehydrogenase catalytic domain-containing protein n=1 Tax=Paenibacillus sp. TaxID=58172 RepID=UPI002D3C6026|nr:alcohol dehydrogenase catalytic domain-containing protein [Paenibacillus sp.]HZG56719.1 alcohol dehydrogenase catalytic domain-containing protein [Paenibacillus sp.]